MCDTDFYNAMNENYEVEVKKQAKLDAMYAKEYARHMNNHPVYDPNRVDMNELINRIDRLERRMEQLVDMVETYTEQNSNKLFVTPNENSVAQSQELFKQLMHRVSQALH